MRKNLLIATGLGVVLGYVILVLGGGIHRGPREAL